MLIQTYLIFFFCGTKKVNCKECYFSFLGGGTIHLRCLCLIAISVPLFIPSVSGQMRSLQVLLVG